MTDNNDVRQAALTCLLIRDPIEKVAQTQALYQRWQSGELSISQTDFDVPELPGQPDKPELVAPRDLPRRRNSAETGVATLIHAVNHIEFNAINLALDAVARFAGLPDDYYGDWMRVAFEESQHFTLLREHLM